MRALQQSGHSDSPDSLPSPGQMLRRALDVSPATPSSRHQPDYDTHSPSLHALRARRAEAQTHVRETERSTRPYDSSPLFLSSDDALRAPELPALPSRQDLRVQKRTQKQTERLADLAKKQSVREANKIRHSKTDAMHDIIIHVDGNLVTSNGVLSSSFEQLRTRLEEHGVGITVRTESKNGCIFFERRVRAKYNPEEQLWEPLGSEYIMREPTVVVLVSGEHVVDAIERGSLKEVVRDACGHFTNDKEIHGEQPQVLLLVVGLETYFRKRRANRNRDYTQAVRRRLQGEGPVTQNMSLNDDEQHAKVNSGLLGMQMLHRCHVVRLNTVAELVDCLHSITGDVAVRPYRHVSADKASAA